MTVHAIRVIAGPQSSWDLDQINAEMDDWVSKQSEWESDPDEHVIRPVSAGIDGTGTQYFNGIYRFTLESEPKANLLQKCEDKLVNKCLWYRLAYHSCNHDEEDPQPCSWDEVREWVDKDASGIPDDVPSPSPPTPDDGDDDGETA